MSHSLQAWITQSHLQISPCLRLSFVSNSPDGATPNWGSRHRTAAYYSFINHKGM